MRFNKYAIHSQQGMAPFARIEITFKGQELTAESHGDGGYDAFMKALRKALRQVDVKLPKLLDYEVRIPPGGATDALVGATITWDSGGARPLVTTGLDSDQVFAAMQATQKMINILFAEKPEEK